MHFFIIAPIMHNTRNRFLQNGLQQVGEMGVIPGKVFRDEALICRFQEDAVDADRAPRCFPNGNLDSVHDAREGDTSIGLRERRAGDLDNTLEEEGIVSVCGLCWEDFASQDGMESAYYWQGIVTTPDESEKQMDANQSDPTSQGHGTIIVGTKSVVNSGPETFYPGDPIVWEMPMAPFHPCYDGNGGVDRINKYTSRGGNPLQHKIIYRPFDPTDLGVHFAAAYANMTITSSEGGIKDLPFTDALPQQTAVSGSRRLSAIQEEALSYKFGIWGIGLAIVECLLNNNIITTNDSTVRSDGTGGMMEKILDECRIFGGKDDIVLEGIENVLLRNISPADGKRREAQGRLLTTTGIQVRDAALAAYQSTNSLQSYATLRAHLCDVWTQGLTSTWSRKCSKIVGRALNAAAPNDTLDGLWGHFRQ